VPLVVLVVLVALLVEDKEDREDREADMEDRATDMVVDNNHMDYMTCSTKMCIFLIIYIF
jgi:hypothetical protein